MFIVRINDKKRFIKLAGGKDKTKTRLKYRAKPDGQLFYSYSEVFGLTSKTYIRKVYESITGQSIDDGLSEQQYRRAFNRLKKEGLLQAI